MLNTTTRENRVLLKRTQVVPSHKHPSDGIRDRRGQIRMLHGLIQAELKHLRHRQWNSGYKFGVHQTGTSALCLLQRHLLHQGAHLEIGIELGLRRTMLFSLTNSSFANYWLMS